MKFFLICLLCMLSGSVQAQTPKLNQALPRNFVSREHQKAMFDYAKARSLPISDNQSIDAGLSTKQLEKIEKKRFVFLGEGSHFVREKYQYRLSFIKSLVQKGFTRIGLEIGRFDGIRINRYIQTGDLNELRKVGIYQFENVSSG